MPEEERVNGAGRSVRGPVTTPTGLPSTAPTGRSESKAPAS